MKEDSAEHTLTHTCMDSSDKNKLIYEFYRCQILLPFVREGSKM